MKNRILTIGGIGDILLMTPTIRALKEQKPNEKLIIFCWNKSHAEVFKHNPFVDEIRLATFKDSPIDYIRYMLKRLPVNIYHYAQLSPSKFYKKNATEIIAEMAQVELRQKNIEIYLTEEEEQQAREVLNLYSNPIIIHVTSHCSKNQEWEIENWEQLIRLNPDKTFIQLGLADEPPIKGSISFLGKTSLREAFALIKFAKGFVGVISSFAHATNAFDTKGVVLFGPSTPKVWGHSNNINLSVDMSCSPCIDVLFNSPCPFDKACMKAISVMDVHEALNKQLVSEIYEPMLV